MLKKVVYNKSYGRKVGRFLNVHQVGEKARENYSSNFVPYQGFTRIIYIIVR